MRETKFRLRDRFNKLVGYEKWYVGEWEKDEGENFHPDSGYYISQPCWLYSLDNERWTPSYIPHRFKDQYISLKDKNSVEIYEGDIVQWWNKVSKPAVVEATNGGWNPFIDSCTTDHPYHYVVIGNIYENLELLKEKDND